MSAGANRALLRLSFTVDKYQVETGGSWVQDSDNDWAQKALRAAKDEITQLKGTVNALRDELEKTRIGEQERLQRALASAGDEIRQLKETINALRDQLELRKRNHHEQLQNLELAYRSELAELQQMVKVMREKLEEVDARAR